jgi:chromosome segregation ATPase
MVATAYCNRCSSSRLWTNRCFGIGAEDSANGEPSQIQVEEEIKTFQKNCNQDQAQLVKKKEQAAQHSDQLQELDERATLAKNDLKDLQQEYEDAGKDAAPD